MAKRKRGQSERAQDLALATKIRLLRTRRKLQQQELARMVGVSIQQLSKYEAAINSISAARLSQIASALGVSMSYFFDPEDRAAHAKSLLVLNTAAKIRLARAFARIKDRHIRRQLIALVEAFARRAGR